MLIRFQVKVLIDFNEGSEIMKVTREIFPDIIPKMYGRDKKNTITGERFLKENT